MSALPASAGAVRLSGAIALAAAGACYAIWGWRAGAGVALGWMAAAGSLFLNALFLPGAMEPGAGSHGLTARIYALGIVKLPIAALFVYLAVRLGAVAAACFVAGACSVYLALAAGTAWSLRSRE